jgi:CubicO group peptidase (beta-lactamase class C family)
LTPFRAADEDVHMSLQSRLEKLAGRLEERAAEQRVPGAALAVMQGDEVFEATTGVLNRNTGVETTPDSLFQIGSITKTFTSTLVMQLVDEGRVDLDAPVWAYLPELQLADGDAAEQITVRQLLTHTSGIDGDFFEDTGRGDDCIERYVLACRALPQLHAPGELFSYCNAGFALLGRVIEKLRATTWDQALRDHVLRPIATTGMGTLPEEALLHRAASGHIVRPGSDEPSLAPIWRLPASNGPAGATPFACARDLLRFARAHIDDGLAESGARILAEGTAARMRELQVSPPAGALASGWGLGWMLFDWGPEPVFGHDGGTIGQFAFLRILPERRAAIALLTNGGNASQLYRDLFNDVLAELSDLAIPPLPTPDPSPGLDLSLYEGRYERLQTGIDVGLEQGVLKAESRGLRGILRALPVQTDTLEPVSRETFLAHPSSPLMPTSVVSFLEFDTDGRPGYLHAGGRASPRR